MKIAIVLFLSFTAGATAINLHHVGSNELVSSHEAKNLEGYALADSLEGRPEDILDSPDCMDFVSGLDAVVKKILLPKTDEEIIADVCGEQERTKLMDVEARREAKVERRIAGRNAGKGQAKKEDKCEESFEEALVSQKGKIYAALKNYKACANEMTRELSVIRDGTDVSLTSSTSFFWMLPLVFFLVPLCTWGGDCEHK